MTTSRCLIIIGLQPQSVDAVTRPSRILEGSGLPVHDGTASP